MYWWWIVGNIAGFLAALVMYFAALFAQPPGGNTWKQSAIDAGVVSGTTAAGYGVTVIIVASACRLLHLLFAGW